MTKRRAAIVSPLRTPVGRFLGALAPLTAGDLGAAILKALIERSGIVPARVDDVVFSRSKCPATSSTGAAAQVCRRWSTRR